MFTCDGFHDKFKDLNIITSFQSIGILEVDLVLPNSYFMVTCFYFKTEISKNIYNFATCIASQIGRCQIKISTFIVYFQCGFLIFIKLEEEKFRFWAKIEFFKAQFFHIAKITFQYTTWISWERLSFCCINITNNASYFSILISPREDNPCVPIWIEVHI